MIDWELNKRVWKSTHHYDQFIIEANKLSDLIANKPHMANDFLSVANSIDDIMQEYESNFCPVEDPLFFFALSTANALFLQIGKQFDGLGSTRIGYIVNGYKEGLTKHLLYPSYSFATLEMIIKTYFQFANDQDKNWLNDNSLKFVPIDFVEN